MIPHVTSSFYAFISLPLVFFPSHSPTRSFYQSLIFFYLSSYLFLLKSCFILLFHAFFLFFHLLIFCFKPLSHPLFLYFLSSLSDFCFTTFFSFFYLSLCSLTLFYLSFNFFAILTIFLFSYSTFICPLGFILLPIFLLAHRDFCHLPFRQYIVRSTPPPIIFSLSFLSPSRPILSHPFSIPHFLLLPKTCYFLPCSCY